MNFDHIHHAHRNMAPTARTDAAKVPTVEALASERKGIG